MTSATGISHGRHAALGHNRPPGPLASARQDRPGGRENAARTDGVTALLHRARAARLLPDRLRTDPGGPGPRPAQGGLDHPDPPDPDRRGNRLAGGWATCRWPGVTDVGPRERIPRGRAAKAGGPG